METFVTVGLRGKNYVVLVCGHPALKGVELTEREARIVRDYLCSYLGIPSAEQIERSCVGEEKRGDVEDHGHTLEECHRRVYDWEYARTTKPLPECLKRVEK